MDIIPDTFEYFHPGRRLVFTYPIVHLNIENPELAGESITVSVLDSALEREGEVECAAMLVPRGKEEDWVYCSEGGQWQLISSAGTSRLIIISRNPLSQGIECRGVGESSEERKKFCRKIKTGALGNGEDGNGYHERLLSLEKRRRNGREARTKAEVSGTSEISSGVERVGQKISGDEVRPKKQGKHMKMLFLTSLEGPERGDVRDERGKSSEERNISGAEIGRKKSKQDGSMRGTKRCRERKSSEPERKRSKKCLRGLDAERENKSGRGERIQKERTQTVRASEEVETYDKEHWSWAEKGSSHFKKIDVTDLVKGRESAKDQEFHARTIQEIEAETQKLRQECKDTNFKDNRISVEKTCSQPRQIVRNGEREEFQGARTNISEEVQIKHEEILGHVCKCSSCEDELFKKRLGSLVVALAPRICFCSGLPSIPFVSYTDNIVHRVIIEEAYSPLTGHMLVEDVALGEESIKMVEDNNSALLSKDFELHQMTSNACRVCGDGNVKIVWRRRLRFRRMPNLIQTEVPLIFPLEIDSQKSFSKGLLGPHKSCRPRVHLCNCLNRALWIDTYAKENSRKNTSIDHETQTEDGILKSNQIFATRSTNANSGVLFEDTLSCAEVDHSQLVHKYLPPIVAGLVLAASCIESCTELGKKVKVLTLGVGGGALPTFLHRHFGFHVQAVDLDKVVLDLARRHFGLVEDKLMKLESGNALHIINKIATEVANLGASSNPSMASRQKAAETPDGLGSNLDPDTTSPSHSELLYVPDKRIFNNGRDETTQQSHTSSNNLCLSCKTVNPGCLPTLCDLCDPRVHVIVIDVDEGDARSGLSSPPLSFLDNTFLNQTRIALHVGGMLAMNVVPNGKQSYREVITALSSVFDEVYETAVDGDVNRVVFALPEMGTGLHLDCPFARSVKSLLLDTQLLTRIHKVF